jgi:hypothetical protein
LECGILMAGRRAEVQAAWLWTPRKPDPASKLDKARRGRL